MEKKVLQMIFKTEDGSKTTLSIPEFDDIKTDTEISTAMDELIAKDVFVAKTGAYVSKEQAKVVVTNTSEVTL